MIWAKACAAILIFLLLFAGAWTIQQNMERNSNYSKWQINSNGDVHIIDINPESGEIELLPEHIPFLPREYIRIKTTQ